MGECSIQPLAQGKGVHREVESEGSRRQSSDPRKTNNIRRKALGKTARQALHGACYNDITNVILAIDFTAVATYGVRHFLQQSL